MPPGGIGSQILEEAATPSTAWWRSTPGAHQRERGRWHRLDQAEAAGGDGDGGQDVDQAVGHSRFTGFIVAPKARRKTQSAAASSSQLAAAQMDAAADDVGPAGQVVEAVGDLAGEPGSGVLVHDGMRPGDTPDDPLGPVGPFIRAARGRRTAAISTTPTMAAVP